MISNNLSKNLKNIGKMMKQARAFSHGPYNPLHYKHVAVDEDMPS
jgi:hypothetical protein